MDVLEPLWQQDPGSYEVNLARAIAFTMRRSIADARGTRPCGVWIRRAARRAMPSASLARCWGRASNPASRSIATQTTCRWPTPSGSLMLASGTRLSAGYARYSLRATSGSGLDRVAGGAAIHEQTWGELAQALGGLTVSGRVGSATSDARRRPQHALGIQWRASDAFTIGVEQSHGFVVISPRTVELGLTEQRYRGDFVWTPTLATTVAAEALPGVLRREPALGTEVAPRRAFVRTESMNLDLGLSAYRLETSRDLANGVLTTRGDMRRTRQPRTRISKSARTSVSACWSLQELSAKDSARSISAAASAEATLGIYEPWSTANHWQRHAQPSPGERRVPRLRGVRRADAAVLIHPRRESE